MAAKDFYNRHVKSALDNDGWDITHDELRLRWQNIIEEVLIEHTRVPFAHGDVKPIVIFDRRNDHYLLIAIGWDGVKRVHACITHVEIKNHKIWVQQDGTEYGVTDELIEKGIPAEDIVLSFHYDNLNALTGLPMA